jgi:hypothetical protein
VGISVTEAPMQAFLFDPYYVRVCEQRKSRRIAD